VNTNELLFESVKSKIYKIVKHSLQTVPYYRQNWGFDLPESIEEFDYAFFSSNVPILDKDIVRNDSGMFISDSFNKEDLDCETTSGTTGKPLVCYKSRDERFLYTRAIWQARLSRTSELRLTDNTALFDAQHFKGKNTTTGPFFYNRNVLLLSPYDLTSEQLKIYWQELLKFKPKLINGPVIPIYNLALIVKQNNLPEYDIKLIELTNEYASDHQIDFIKESFNCEVVNCYASKEFWTIAYSCKKNHLHALNEYVFVESIYNSRNNANELVVTALNAKSWPLIRYRIGDLGNLFYEKKCSCGNINCFNLEIRKGRDIDHYTLMNGKVVSLEILGKITERINEKFRDRVIHQHQMVIQDDSHLTINLCCDETQDQDEVLRCYRDMLLNSVGDDIELDIVVTDLIPQDKQTGKYRELINLSSTN